MSLVSVIGAGSLANVFANVLHEFLPEFKLHSVLGRSQEKAEVFASKYSCQAVFNIDDFLKEAAPVVVELAGGAALKDYALPILKSGRTLICLSSGAFADEDFKQQAILTASENNGRICIVNGASAVWISCKPAHCNADQPKSLLRQPNRQNLCSAPLA